MPLLGKKVFNCLKSLNDVKPEETIFIISHTKEQFRSKAEFEKRKDLYEERIWTCQCTGHINLTHEEAWNSEKAVQKTLKSQFPSCFEKPVLEIVHHSTLPLDTLVDQAWLKLQQVLSLKEQVSLRIKNAASSGKGFTGTVVMIDTTGVQANPTSNCSSPSSDKENSSGEGKDLSPKKWVPPKLLPYKYSIKLDEEDKIINSIPASDLVRVERPPSKELLRLFIRASAIRVGVTPTSPWVVSDALVKKYSLPSKFADFLVSPAKMAEASKRAEEECSKKRKHSLQHKPSSVKKLKKCKSSTKLSDSKKGSSSAKTKLKKKEKSPSKRKSSQDVVILSDDSSDDEILANLKNSNDSDSDTPLVSLKNQLTPKKKKNVEQDSESESDTPLSKLSKSPKKKKLKLDSSPRKSKTPKTDSQKKKKTQTKSAKKLNADGSPKKRGRPRKDESSTPSSKKGKKTPTKKGMKQTTLLGIATKGKGPKHSPAKSPRKTPIILPKVIKDLAKLDEDHRLYKLKLKKAARVVQPNMFPLLPEKIKDLIIKKYEDRAERQLLAKMSPEQKEAYFKEKRLRSKAERLQKQKANLQRFEDLEIKGPPLPPPKLVPTPDGIPNEYFGDITMITEFLSTYAGLLMPEEQNPVTSEDLMKYLASGTRCFESVSQVLVILLQTLLQDEIAQGYKELRTPLVDLRVNTYNASELVRLCLRKHDSTHEADDSLEEEDSDEVPDRIIQQLETQDFHQLDAISKLKIIQGLCLRILGSYSVQDYMESKQQEAIDTSRDHRKKWKQNKKDGKEIEIPDDLKDERPGGSGDEKDGKQGSMLAHFYGKLKEGETDSGSAAGESMDDGDGSDLLNVIKSRRIRAAKTAEEKERKEKEKREQREREYREYREMLAKERHEKICKEMAAFARRVVRHVPIGMDRNHSRYWLFHSTSPAIFVEKGWVNVDISYNCQHLAEDSKPTTPKKSESQTSGSQPNTPSKKKNSSDISTPHPGQNLWFVYETPEEIEQLINTLHKKGVRESSLLTHLKQQEEDLVKAMRNKVQISTVKEEVEELGGDEEMLSGFKKELFDLEHRIRNGGLGGVTDFDEWEAKVKSATGIKELGSCLKEVQQNIIGKFFRGFMKITPGYTTVQVKEETVEEGGNEDDEEETEGKGKSVAWFKAIDSCPTLSRLHVLLSMLDSCICWEKSAGNAKCKICRKKGNDSAVLLCDECNQAFHMYCLRPALAYIPKGEWFCPACIPETKRRRCRDVKRYNADDDYEENDDLVDEDDIEHEEECAECGGDEGLVNCATCPSAYHLECHNPPLRHPPRGRWVCTDCKSGTRGTRRSSRKSQQSSAARKARKKVYKESSEEDEEDEETEEEVLPSRRKEPSSRRETSQSRGRSSSRRREPVEDAIDQKPVYSRRPLSELSIIEEILEKVMKHKSAWPFLEAVDKKEVPDYYQIVKHPMDFHTMKNKLVRLSYSSPDEVIKDTALVFRNAAVYNKEDSEVYRCMQEVEKAFVDTLSKKLPFYHYSREPLSNGFDDHGYSSRKRSRR